MVVMMDEKDKLSEELKTVSFAEASKITGFNRRTILRRAMDPEYPDLNAVRIPGMRPRVRLADLIEWARGRKTA